MNKLKRYVIFLIVVIIYIYSGKVYFINIIRKMRLLIIQMMKENLIMRKTQIRMET